jgi:hypothetical protein
MKKALIAWGNKKSRAAFLSGVLGDRSTLALVLRA